MYELKYENLKTGVRIIQKRNVDIYTRLSTDFKVCLLVVLLSEDG